MVQKISVDSDEMAREEQRLKNLQEKVGQLARLDPEVVRRRLELIEKAVPSEKDALVGIVIINQSATTEGLVVESISVSPGKFSTASGNVEKSEADLNKGLVFQVNLSGSQESVMRFLKPFSKLSFPLIIPSRADVSQIGGKVVNGRFEMTALWREIPSVVGGENKPVPILTQEEEAFLAGLERVAIVPPEGVATENVPVGGKSSLF
jgi:hypothetical protein